MEEKYRDTVLHNHMTSGILSDAIINARVLGIACNSEGYIIECNRYVTEMTGYTYGEIIGQKWRDLFISQEMHQELAEILPAIKKPWGIENLEYYILRKDGSKVNVLWNVNKLYDVDNREISTVFIGIDFAPYDVVTGLPNRVMFLERLITAVEGSSTDCRYVSLVYLNVFNFKYIYEILGQIKSNRLLKDIGEKIKGRVARDHMVARMGNQGFAVLLLDHDEKQAAEFASTTIEYLKQTYSFENYQLHLFISCGIAVYPEHGDTAHTLLKNAEIAMGLAEKQKENHYVVFNEKIKNDLSAKISLYNGLKCALYRKELVVYYQPQIELETGKLIGIEALVRWLHPVNGLTAPGEFIPLAEESELITEIDEYVLRAACKQNKQWQSKGYAPIAVSVNLSVRQFERADFVERVRDILHETGLNGRWLHLEITESTAMKDIKQTIYNIEGLKKMGIKIALDDFGTGYSSLNYLGMLPVDSVKIDPAFMRDMEKQTNKGILMREIINLVHKFQYTVIAEGVETPEQLSFLKDQNCDKAQGYLFSRPLSANMVERFVEIGCVPFENL